MLHGISFEDIECLLNIFLRFRIDKINLYIINKWNYIDPFRKKKGQSIQILWKKVDKEWYKIYVKNKGRRISDADMEIFIPYMDIANPKFRIYIAKILYNLKVLSK